MRPETTVKLLIARKKAMNSFHKFTGAALPWIATGLLLAVFFARAASRKNAKEKKEDYSSEGMSIGMCFGVAIATALQINVGLGMMAGMVLGLIIGTTKEKGRE